MKKFWLMAILTGLASAQNPHMTSRSGGKVQQSVVFDGKTFFLKFIDETRIVALNEYYLRDETPEHWTQMVSVSMYKTDGSPAAMARNMEQSLLQAHPDAPHQLGTSADGGQAWFRCVNWAGDRKTGSEFAVFRFQRTPRGVLGYQVSLRPYQAGIAPAEYQALQDRWTQKLQAEKFPDVTLQMP